MAVSGLRSGALPLIHHHRLRSPLASSPFVKLNVHSNSKRFTLFARYAQTQDLFSSRRFQDSIEKLPKLVEDVVQTFVETGPWGALRLVQGVQAFLGVGQEWLTDASKVTVPYNKDSSPIKLNLGVGAYRTEEGKPLVLDVVK